VTVGARYRQLATLLRVIEHAPSGRDQYEPSTDQHVAQDMEQPEMWVALPAEDHFEQVPGIVRKPINFRKPALQQARQEVDGEGKTIHFGKQRDQKRAERAE